MNEVSSNIADRLRSASCGDPERPTPQDLHAVEHGGYHVPAEPAVMTATEVMVRRDERWDTKTGYYKEPRYDGAGKILGWRIIKPGAPGYVHPHVPVHEVVLDHLKNHGVLPLDAKARKAVPVATGFIDYFPDAIAAVAELSRIGNDQHNPGKPLHWDRSKSGDEGDALARHFLDRGKVDTDGVRHSTKVAWRALALLQKELEAAR